MTVSPDFPLKASIKVTFFLIGLCLSVVLLQQQLDVSRNRTAILIDEFSGLLPAEYIKPALLGYHHLGADVLWLRLVQVLGKRANTVQDFQWLYHALDVITTLDPLYDYPYQVGGIVLMELGQRVDWSNSLLKKGMDAKPGLWQMPFYLGYNHFFYLQDYAKAAEYMSRASALPGRPSFVPLLATRLYAQGGDPTTGLNFLLAMRHQVQDELVKERLETRIKEVMIERDIQNFEQAVATYVKREGKMPASLIQLVTLGFLPALPQEPFGGVYLLDSKTGTIVSSTHPERLRVKRTGQPQTSPPPSTKAKG